MSHQKIGPVDAGVRQIINGNQIQDGRNTGIGPKIYGNQIQDGGHRKIG
jgi:hypothetical protein